jgi:hypothetical protein
VEDASRSQGWLDLDEAASRLHVSEERVAAMAVQGPLRYRRRNDSLQVMEKSVERELKWRTRNPTLRQLRNGLRFLFRYVLLRARTAARRSERP